MNAGRATLQGGAIVRCDDDHERRTGDDSRRTAQKAIIGTSLAELTPSERVEG